jgi:hypothetical protein
VPRREITPSDARSGAGLAGLKNGDLLAAAEIAGFDVFLTLDRGIEHQQNLVDRKIAIIVFRAKSSRLKDLLPLIPACLTAIESIQVGQLIRIESSGG